MTRPAGVGDGGDENARLRDSLASVLAIDCGIAVSSSHAREIADALLPVVSEYAERQARQTAAAIIEEEAADWEASERVGTFSRRLRARAAGLTDKDGQR